jgi:hypothetical protein
MARRPHGEVLRRSRSLAPCTTGVAAILVTPSARASRLAADAASADKNPETSKLYSSSIASSSGCRDYGQQTPFSPLAGEIAKLAPAKAGLSEAREGFTRQRHRSPSPEQTGGEPRRAGSPPTLPLLAVNPSQAPLSLAPQGQASLSPPQGGRGSSLPALRLQIWCPNRAALNSPARSRAVEPAPGGRRGGGGCGRAPGCPGRAAWSLRR